MPSYLRRRGCTWFFRWKWPKRLAANHGSGELIRSLKTGDYRTARRRALMLVLKIETMTSSMDNPSRAELETAVRGWIDACVWRREIRRAETGGLPAAEGEQQLSIERPSYGCPRMSKPPKLSKTDNTTRPDTKTEADVSASIGDNVDNVFDLPVIDEDTILTGAAADATDLDEKLKGLPRILRVAFLINQGSRDIHDRLVADIETLCPGLPLTAAFATVDDPATALDLAKELDRRAVADDVPELRHIADCVRLLSLPMQKDLAGSEDSHPNAHERPCSAAG
jgi:hypothetical protein